jgi:hypothetical protein
MQVNLLAGIKNVRRKFDLLVCMDMNLGLSH